MQISKILIFLLLLILLSIATTAKQYVSCEREIKVIAKSLGTIEKIDFFVENRTDYKFYWKKQDMCYFWYSREGDCTDKAYLKVFMINSIGKNARTVYGYYNSDYRLLHDFYQYWNGKRWISSEPKSKIKGIGIW